MKQSKLSIFFPLCFLILGGGASGCSRWLFASCLDDLGLVIPASLPEILLWVLVALAFVGAFVCARCSNPSGKGNVLAALGDLICAAGVFTLTMTPAKGPATMVTLFRVFTYASVVGLVASGVMRMMGKAPHYLMTLPVCVLNVLFLAECYQYWSEVPQLMEYILGVGAVLGLALFSYHWMARNVDLPFKPRHLAYGFLGIFFCTAATAVGVYSLYFAAAALWMTADLTAACASVPQEA